MNNKFHCYSLSYSFHGVFILFQSNLQSNVISFHVSIKFLYYNCSYKAHNHKICYKLCTLPQYAYKLLSDFCFSFSALCLGGHKLQWMEQGLTLWNGKLSGTLQYNEPPHPRNCPSNSLSYFSSLCVTPSCALTLISHKITPNARIN